MSTNKNKSTRRFTESNKVRRHRSDVSIILITMALVAFGLIVIYAISPILSHRISGDVDRNYFVYGQLRNIGVALVAFIFASKIHWRNWQYKFLSLLIIASSISLAMTFVPGLAITQGGATRWVGIGGLSFQPAELVKLTVLVGLAAWFAKLQAADFKNYKMTLLPVIIISVLVAGFILIHQRDMGTMVVIVGIIMSIFYASGVSLYQFGVLMAAGIAFFVANIVLFPHRMERVRTFFDPSSNLAESGYHLHQSLIAVGSGGMLGLGLGKSIQVYGYLPEAVNDSIFAIIAEMFGFVGALFVVILFGLLVYRVLIVARDAPDSFSQLFVVGVAAWIGIQASVNMMAMIGIIPLTGIPLPFVSYGGSSLVFMMIALGIVVNISRYTERSMVNANSTSRRRQRRPSNTRSSRS
ncbi:MAG: putative peptidoglycan glycosyltransferase FtsW [Candidatus Saccharimonadales bacterium]